MRLIQFVTPDQQRAVALVLSGTEVQPLEGVQTVYQLANQALAEKNHYSSSSQNWLLIRNWIIRP